MEFLEKDLEQIIFESNNEELRKRGLPIIGRKIRQLNIGRYGISDIITYRRRDTYTEDYSFFTGRQHIVTIYELKKNKIGISALLQAVRYSKGIQSFFEKRNFDNYKINIVLIGREIDLSGDFVYLTDIFKSISFYTYEYRLNGMIFTHKSGYKLKDEGF